MAGTAVAQTPFSYFRVQTSVDPASFGSVTWVDIDRDGDQDLMLAASTGAGSRVPTTVIYRQLGTLLTTTEEGVPRPVGEYAATPIGGAPDLWLADVDWGDYDGDGDLDAVVSGTDRTGAMLEPVLRILEGDGAGTLKSVEPSGVTAVIGTVSWGDWDNDGDIDLLTAGTTTGGVSTTLYRNDEGALESVDVNLPGISLGDAAWADLDLDGDLDLGLCGVEDDGRLSARVFLNDGPGSFRELVFGGLGVAFCSLDWGDYDEDGFPDLLVSGGRPSHLVMEGTTRVYRNAGGGDFVMQPFDLAGIVGGTARWMDFDNDGALDVVTNGGADLVFGKAVTRLYRNEQGTFRHVSNISGTFPGRFDAGDFDADGDLDIVSIGLDRDGVAVTNVFMNGELLPNSPPSVPGDLRSAVAGGSAALSWSASTDEQTSSRALSYNLRLGSRPGSGDVMSVPVDESGRPVRSSPGNVGSNTSWTIRDLPNGTYYWSVQAVDHALNASGFAADQAFEITASAGTKPVAEDPVPAGPGEFRLAPPYPNPAYSAVRIVLELPRPQSVRLTIYDALGRPVASLLDAHRATGRHAVSWDGRDAGGRPVAAGTYFVRLSADEGVRYRSVTVTR